MTFLEQVGDLRLCFWVCGSRSGHVLESVICRAAASHCERYFDRLLILFLKMGVYSTGDTVGRSGGRYQCEADVSPTCGLVIRLRRSLYSLSEEDDVFFCLSICVTHHPWSDFTVFPYC